MPYKEKKNLQEFISSDNGNYANKTLKLNYNKIYIIYWKLTLIIAFVAFL